MTATQCLVEFVGQETPYERNIYTAAKGLVDSGNAEWKYLTQFVSGTTVWHLNERSVMIKADIPAEKSL